IPITVKHIETETPGYLSVFFKRPRSFVFDPGDWIEFGEPDDQPAGGKVYSLSSSPHEPDLQITFREGISPFKKMLAVLKPGDELIITEYGNDYGFQLNEHRPSVLIAGGVGIAPFRSMIKEMAELGSNNSVHLIYFNTSEDFLYKQELEEWQRQLLGLEVSFIATKTLRRKDREKLLRELLPSPDHQYYVSGPSGMVSSTVQLLEKSGVTKKSIKVDDFGHY
ncbi:MAG: FAD-binding oxidoreductase, partial [Candidatus Saccharibacteria bacterium]|nr:FAD-binding oxidoreductase [Candidatus Saccharibacteria bacterium]